MHVLSLEIPERKRNHLQFTIDADYNIFGKKQPSCFICNMTVYISSVLSVLDFYMNRIDKTLLKMNSISTIALDWVQATLCSFLRTLLQILLVVVFCRPKLTCLLHLNHNLVLVLSLHLLDEVLSDSLLFF